MMLLAHEGVSVSAQVMRGFRLLTLCATKWLALKAEIQLHQVMSWMMNDLWLPLEHTLEMSEGG